MNERTLAFDRAWGMKSSIEELERRLAAIGTPKKLFDTIHNCPFVGFVDKGRKRVGCMIHPVHHGGRELRDISLYGAKLCNNHECPSFSYLTDGEKAAVSTLIDDWYLYGLVICDIDLVKEYFFILGNALGEEVKASRMGGPLVRRAARDFFALKERWPFRDNELRFGKYSFSISEYRIERDIAATELSLPPSRYRKIFLSLETKFSSEAEFERATGIMDRLFSDFITHYREAA